MKTEEEEFSLAEQIEKFTNEVAIYATLIQSKEFAYYRQALGQSIEIKTAEIMNRALPSVNDGIKGVAVEGMEKGIVKGLRAAVEWPERILDELKEQIEVLRRTIEMKEEAEAEDEREQE